MRDGRLARVACGLAKIDGQNRREGVMKTRSIVLASALGVLLLVLAVTLPTGAQAPSAARLGKVTFPVSCNTAAQKEFETSMAYYHSFAWPQLKASLDRVLQADPTCGMA